ncbi:hypothetical protein AZE42_03433 [Rhizopogon vesiculosus]|uniref:Uncharacterized protein n=1 Tax=Rhizopogon vesiculosus TaxID=180088 RepID=A0A1J8PT84_9AGAM|nr:hypothetical protein AZE42_03433 [Rhizopogon vesiculosus]
MSRSQDVRDPVFQAALDDAESATAMSLSQDVRDPIFRLDDADSTTAMSPSQDTVRDPVF